MSAIKIKILETVHGTLVSVDGRAAYDSGNTGAKEANNLKSLFDKLEFDNIEIEAREATPELRHKDYKGI